MGGRIYYPTISGHQLDQSCTQCSRKPEFQAINWVAAVPSKQYETHAEYLFNILKWLVSFLFPFFLTFAPLGFVAFMSQQSSEGEKVENRYHRHLQTMRTPLVKMKLEHKSLAQRINRLVMKFAPRDRRGLTVTELRGAVIIFSKLPPRTHGASFSTASFQRVTHPLKGINLDRVSQ